MTKFGNIAQEFLRLDAFKQAAEQRKQYRYAQAINEQNALRKVQKLLRRKSIRESIFNNLKNGRK